MQKIKCLIVASALLCAVAFTGCSTYSGDRTEGRVVDDNKITKEVQNKLQSEPVYKFTDVDVKTFAGVVQLSGFVNSNDQKQRAAELAQSVPGVTQVMNSIALKPQPAPTPTGRTNVVQQIPSETAPPPPQPR